MDTTPTPEQPRTLVQRLLGVAPSVLLYLGAAVLAFFLWPSSLGGCTTLIVVSGESMEPTYFEGDIVLARCGVPAVGDVTVYQPEGYGGAKIIHRVIGGDESGWILQGDNNDFIDPLEPTQAEVLGTARAHFPKVGLLATVITSPIVWGSLIVLALALLVWPRNDGPRHLKSDDDDEPWVAPEPEEPASSAPAVTWSP